MPRKCREMSSFYIDELGYVLYPPCKEIGLWNGVVSPRVEIGRDHLSEPRNGNSMRSICSFQGPEIEGWGRKSSSMSQFLFHLKQMLAQATHRLQKLRPHPTEEYKRLIEMDTKDWIGRCKLLNRRKGNSTRIQRYTVPITVWTFSYAYILPTIAR